MSSVVEVQEARGGRVLAQLEALRELSQRSRSLLLGVALFGVLVIVGVTAIGGFASTFNLKSMLVLGSFLGIASIGQTLCALVGGLDLSIPFVIGAANILLLWFIGKGVPAPAAIVVVFALAVLVGLVNGMVSWWVRVHSLVITLAVGFVVVGSSQIATSIGSQFAGNVYGTTPRWLINAVSLRGKTGDLGVPPLIFVWIALSLGVLALLRLTQFGRKLYALGDNRLAAGRALVKEPVIWVAAFVLSAMFAAAAGMLLLGFTGGGIVRVGDPYLFTTVAAVVIGGTSLLGGRGGYGLTILGVCVLTVLQTILVGFGLSPPAQQAVLGALIVAMVALYAREPHPRNLI